MHYWVVTIGFLTLFLSCQSPQKNESTDAKKHFIVATTGMIGDAAQNLLDNSEFKIETMMGPGVDPHLYKATHADLEHLTAAELILYNGLHLEGKLTDVLDKLSRQKPVYPLGDKLPPNRLRHPAGNPDIHDPHIWFDVSLWSEAVRGLGKTLEEQYPENAAAIQASSLAYLDELQLLHEWVKDTIQHIPNDQRIMITAHDAFGYFGAAYGIQVKGLQGISTMSEFGLKDISDLVNYLTEHKIKAVFVESSVPTKSLEAVLEGCQKKGHNLIIGGTLYSDAMGAAGTPDGTYIGMVRHNVRTLVNNLK